MKDFNALIKEKFQDRDFLRRYYHEAAYFRLADQMILLRKERGLTQTELAEKAGTTQTVVSRLENVSVRPSLETVIRLAEALDAVVEVHLVPLEQIQVEQARAATESQSTGEKTALEWAMIPPSEKYTSLFQTGKPVAWEQPTNAWILSKRPALQPVTKAKKMPEFA